ncbi:MAG TPA: hypothetical protein VIF36_04290, partial [Gaiellaceae bacterium]
YQASIAVPSSATVKSASTASHSRMSSRSPSTISASWATIEYEPRERCLESKSLKLYLMTYRDQGHFCEALAVKIRDDVGEALDLPPDHVRVTLVQKARGGITITANS